MTTSSRTITTNDSVVGAISPYAPTGRNTFLRLLAEQTSRSQSTKLQKATSAIILFLLVVKYWKNIPILQQLPVVRELLWCSKRTNLGRLVKQKCLRLWRIIVSSNVWTTLTLNTNTSCSKHQNDTPSIQSTRHSLTANTVIDTDIATDIAKSATTVAAIRTNQQTIQTVLHYWFGQYTPDQAQKKIWMIANSSVEQRRIVDAEIVHKFESTIQQLTSISTSNPETNGIELWREWCDETYYSYQGKVAAIVCFDQFQRHINRHYGNSNNENGHSFDNLAHYISTLLLERHSNQLKTGMIPIPMYIFGLMPLRHDSSTDASKLASVALVQQHIATMTDLHDQQLDGMIRRFRKATNRRMAIIQDAARRTTTKHSAEAEYTHEDLLETVAFEADMSSAKHHVVYTTISRFLNERGVHHTNAQDQVVQPVIVSLSGGVDSMVICSVLAHMAATDYTHIKVYAIHIDYGNRPESAAEAAFVEQYCYQSKINYKCRRIHEVTRGITARDDYERIARQVRYESYRMTVQESHDHYGNNFGVGVMLGHHRGDLRENVLSNAHKGCGPLDLSGMTAVSQNDGVMIYRPLLPLEKDKIFDYAHTYGVPYFKDTTPHWSTRGKLRNKLIPLLEEIYGEGSMNNLSSLATESDEARELLNKAILAPFLAKVERHPMGITLETHAWKNQGIFFWKLVLREALHGAGLGMFSDKSVLAFLERVQLDKLKAGWLQCRKDYAVYLRQDGKVFVLFPNSFPFRSADQFDCVGQKIQYGKEAVVGPWSIWASVVEVNGRSVESFLEHKAVASMEEFMTGNITYYLKTRKSEPASLGFVSEYSKASRPHAWKNTDTKLQTTLPLLASDESVVDMLDDFDVVRVEMKLVV